MLADFSIELMWKAYESNVSFTWEGPLFREEGQEPARAYWPEKKNYASGVGRRAWREVGGSKKGQGGG